MDLHHGLALLAEDGLNLFAAAPVRDLPEELRVYIPRQFAQHSLCMIGHGGRHLWERLPRNGPDPIDRFSIERAQWFAREVLRDPTAIVAFPGGEWLLPLQRLGRFLNLARPSLCGLDINNEYGVWFAYRAVLLTRAEIPKIVGSEFESPCATCVDRPCVKACPANAVRAEGFQLDLCMQQRREKTSCADRCLAREACPVKAEHRYSLEQIRYHMLRSRA